MGSPRLVVSVRNAVFSFLSLVSAGSAFAAPPGAVISNQASFDYLNGAGQPAAVLSNEVAVTTVVTRSPATVELTRVLATGTGDYVEPVGPSACMQGASFVALPDPVLLGGNAIDPALPASVSRTDSYNIGEPAFIRLQDSDQNVDFQVIDYVDVTVTNSVTADSEIIRLTETGPNTGVFAGYLPTAGGVASSADCVLQGPSNSTIDVSYVDPADATDTAQDTAVLDPSQRVFESRTGSVIDGATIEIVDAVSGLPAMVYGNDGISQFPSSIVSGGTTTDSSGTLYAFGPGEYRFPVVPDGEYRLVVTPPPAYSAPSRVSESELQALPGAPWSLGPASFGAAFTKAGGVSAGFDIPLDPRASALFLQKRALTAIAAPGDFVRYELVLENTSPFGQADETEIFDQLPPGVRFVPGSVRVNGSVAPDPEISPDLGTLTFDIGRLDAGERAQIYYVVEIVGGQRNDELVNTATAFAANGLLSNESTAAIRLTEDLFRSTGTIVGRVLEGSCGQETFTEEQGVPNIRVYLEDGRFAVSDEGGRFHFDGIEPGTHVAQLDTYTVPAYFDIIGCDDTPGFAGRPDSQFVKLKGGALQRADFYLRRQPAPEGRIDIEMRNAGTDSPNRVAYNVRLNGIGNVEIDNISLTVLLPKGVTYVPETMIVDGERRGEPHITGPAISLALDGQFGNWTKDVSFVASIDDDTTGELVTKAIGKFDTPMQSKQQTPVVETRMIREPGIVENAGYVLNLNFAVLSAELSANDRLDVEALIRDWRGVSDIRLSAIGHTDSTPIKAKNRHLFADNYVLSKARATSVAFFIAEALDIPIKHIQVEGRGPDDPVASNQTSDGRFQNRRVELVLSGVRPVQPSFLEVTQESSGTKETATKGAIPGADTARRVAEVDPAIGMPSSQTTPPIDSLEPGYAILLPARGFAPAIPATKVAVKHMPGQKVTLTVNDAKSSEVSFESESTNRAGTVAVSRWQGVELVDGENEIRVEIRNADGSVAKSIRRTINFAGMPIRAELVTDKSVLVADGKTHPVIALRLYDRTDKPARAGLVGNFRVDAPYRSAWDEQQDRRNSIVEIGDRSASFRIGEDGIALLELAPTTRSGEVTIVLPFENQRQQEIRAWLSPSQRDWILVGFAEGTAGYKTLDDNMAAAMDAGHEEGYYDDGRVAFFAKGSIKGEYLLTVAFDSDRDRDAERDRFNTEIDPNAYYTLYADSSEQRFEAASQRKIFVKLERNQFYALFGDFDTGLSVTDLTRYQRRFNGVKSEYRGENVGYTAFAAETDQSFNRDEIRGDGTSGLYQLSSAPIIANSDLVRIETRDRFDSGVVLSSRTLTRFLDYNLDTLSGTLYFKQPVPSRDLDFNPVFIVAEYESLATNTEDVVAGGRGSVRFADDRVEVGVTHVNDATSGAEGDMTGIDLRWQIDSQTLLKAEVADSNSTTVTGDQSGSAQSLEFEHNGENLDVRAFIREVEDGYGLGYQSDADKGVRRLGVDARARLGERYWLEGEAGWQQNLTTDAIRNLARGAVRYERERFTARVGLSHAEDEFDDGESRASSVAEVTVTQRVMDDKLNLRASGSTPLGGEAESIDYPTSYVLGADYRLVDGIDLVAEYEDAQGADLDAQMTRVGVKAQPWNRGQINSFVTNESNEFGPRLFANVGLVQGFQLSERWAFDVGVDHAETLVESTARPFDPDRELPSGSLNEDFTAAFLGAMYSSEFWSANMRIEHRNSDSEDRWSTLVGWYRQPAVGHGLSAGFNAYTVENVQGNEMTSANLRFGWAYRLANKKWSFFDRVDLVYDRNSIDSGEQKTWRVVNNFVANRRISAATQLSLQYAFKYVRSVFDGDGYTGYTDIIGVDWRHGFHPRWDFGVNSSIYHSWRSDVMDYSAGLDVGFNVASNVWVSLGYNFTGFEDKDFEAARYTASGPFLRFSIKADQRLLKRIAGR
ncbi:MAG: OmpA family protein [Woeseiaceae bacterium]|nr:OmpA family protein [Woeseiaceae bacterium]